MAVRGSDCRKARRQGAKSRLSTGSVGLTCSESTFPCFCAVSVLLVHVGCLRTVLGKDLNLLCLVRDWPRKTNCHGSSN